MNALLIRENGNRKKRELNCVYDEMASWYYTIAQNQ